jgi:hypothetical protein
VERQCPRCQAVTTDDRLVRCPDCRSYFGVVGKNPYPLTPEQEGKIYERLRGRLKAYVFGSFSLLAVFSFILGFDSLKSIYDRSVNVLNGLVIQRIDREFQEPRIQELIGTVASHEAKDLLNKQIYPQVSSFQRETDFSIQKLKQLADALDQKYKLENDRLSHDLSNVAVRSAEATKLTNALTANVALLEKRNRDADELIRSLSGAVQDLDRRKTLYDLSAKATHGDRQALTTLMTVSQQDGPGRELAISEIERVKSFWLTVSHIKSTKLVKDGKEIQTDQLSTCELRSALSKSTEFQIRAVCANQLASRRERGVPEALAEAIRGDQHLEVVRDAVLSWQMLTGIPLPDVFGPPDVIEMSWKEKGDSLNQTLAGGPSCNLPTFDGRRFRLNPPPNLKK